MTDRSVDDYIRDIPEELHRTVWHKLGEALRKPHTDSDTNGGAHPDDSGPTVPPKKPPLV